MSLRKLDPSTSMLNKVRLKLDNYGYREHLPPEAVFLVKRLIDDLVSCNKQLKESVLSVEKSTEKCNDLTASLEPFKEENGRLLSQLNVMHMENLKLREDNEKLAKEHENYLSKLRNEKEDLIFLVQELKKQIVHLEEESKSKSDKILQLQEKNLQSVIVTPEGTKKQIPFQRQRMEISSPLKENRMTSESCPTCGCRTESDRSRNKNVYMADLLRMTDRKMTSLQEDIERQKDKFHQADLLCAELNKKVVNRESEIERLQQLLVGGRSVAAVVEDNKVSALHSKLHQLQLENDILVKTNSKLELKLNSVLGNTHEAMTVAMAMEDANQDLSEELKSATTTNKLLKKDCEATAETLSFKLLRNKEKLKDFAGDLKEQHSLFHMTRDERDRLKHELSHFSHSNSCLKEEVSQLSESNSCLKEERHRLEQILARGHGERKAMADKLNTLTVKLQEQEMEVMSLKSEASTLRKTIATLERTKSEIEASQNFFKKETDKLQEQKQELEIEKSYFKTEMIKLQGSNETLEQEKNYYKDQTKELEEQKASVEQARDYYNNDVMKCQEKITELQQIEQRLKNKIHELSDEKIAVEKEKDHYSEQVIQLLDILKVKPSSATGGTKSKLKPEEELPKVTYERDVLKQEVKFYKSQLRSLQNQAIRSKAAADQNVIGESSSALSVEDGSGRGPIGDKKGYGDKEGDVDTEALRCERNYFREQMEHFQHLFNETKMKLMQQRSSRSVSPPSGEGSGRSMSPYDEAPPKDSSDVRALRHELRVSDQEKEFFKEQYERLKSSTSVPMSPSTREGIDVDDLMREKNIFKDERNFYKNQYKELSDKVLQSAVNPPRPSGLKQDMENVLAEKRVLAMAKAQLEAQLKNLQNDFGELQKENQDMNSKKRDLTKSIENLQNAALQKFPPSMQNFVGEIRKSRDVALEDVERLKREREEMRTKLKNLSAQQIQDRSSAQEDFSALQLKRSENEATIEDLQQRLHAQTTLISSLQSQIEALQEALQEAQSQIGMTSEQSKQFKKMLEKQVGETDSQGHQLEIRSNQLATSQTRVLALEGEVSSLQQEVARLGAEGVVLRGNLGKMDNDKDTLSTELDSKSEFIMTLKKELQQRTAQIAGLQAQINKMQTRIDSCESTIEIEQRKLSEESQRCDRFQQDLAITTEQKEASNREIRRLQKELIGSQHDLKEVKMELERTQACRENFKRKAQEYCRTLEHINESMTNKDKEQEHFVQEYLSLNETVASLKDLNASLEESAATQSQELNRMEELIKSSKQEREELIEQLNHILTKNEALETKCRELEEKKFEVEKNLLTSQDTTQKIELRRSEADTEAQRLALSVEKLLEDKRSLETRLESISAQLSSERKTIRSMEEILSEKRKNEFIMDSNLKQLGMEKSQMQRKLNEISSELESELSETKRLRSKCSNLELEFERAKRQATNEQYERERIEQELRRVRKYSDMSGALSALGRVCDQSSQRQSQGPPLYPSDKTTFHPPQQHSPSLCNTKKGSSGVSRTSSDGLSGRKVLALYSDRSSFDKPKPPLSSSDSIEASSSLKRRNNELATPPAPASPTGTYTISSSFSSSSESVSDPRRFDLSKSHKENDRDEPISVRPKEYCPRVVPSTTSYSLHSGSASSGSLPETSLHTEPFPMASESQSVTSTRRHSSSHSLPHSKPPLTTTVTTFYSSIANFPNEKPNGKTRPTTNGHH